MVDSFQKIGPQIGPQNGAAEATIGATGVLRPIQDDAGSIPAHSRDLVAHLRAVVQGRSRARVPEGKPNDSSGLFAKFKGALASIRFMLRMNGLHGALSSSDAIPPMQVAAVNQLITVAEYGLRKLCWTGEAFGSEDASIKAIALADLLAERAREPHDERQRLAGIIRSDFTLGAYRQLAMSFQRYVFEDLLQISAKWIKDLNDGIEGNQGLQELKLSIARDRMWLDKGYISQAAVFAEAHEAMQGVMDYLIAADVKFDSQMLREWWEAMREVDDQIHDANEVMRSLEQELHLLEYVGDSQSLKAVLGVLSRGSVSTVRSAVQLVASINKCRATTRRIEMKLDEMPLWIIPKDARADFVRALNGLLVTALKSADLEKSNRNIAVQCSEEGSHLHLSVVDNGSGIDDVDALLCGHAAANGRAKGLQSALRIAERRGWQLKVESKPKEWTTATLTMDAIGWLDAPGQGDGGESADSGVETDSAAQSMGDLADGSAVQMSLMPAGAAAAFGIPTH